MNAVFVVGVKRSHGTSHLTPAGRCELPGGGYWMNHYTVESILAEKMSIDNQRSPEGDDQQAEQQGAAQPEKQWQRQAQGQHDTQKATSQSEGEDTSDGAVLYEVDEISASKAHPREGVPGWKWISLVAVGLIGGVVHGKQLGPFTSRRYRLSKGEGLTHTSLRLRS